MRYTLTSFLRALSVLVACIFLLSAAVGVAQEAASQTQATVSEWETPAAKKPTLLVMRDYWNKFYDMVIAPLLQPSFPRSEARVAVDDKPKPPTDQERAVLMARQGQYDAALVILKDLRLKDPNNSSILRDTIAVLSWSGQDQEAVALFETMPPQSHPDYILAAMGHSYRNLKQTDKALAQYRIGYQLFPANGIFAEGEVRCLIDKGDLDMALMTANRDLIANPNWTEILNAKNDIAQAILVRDVQHAVNLARNQYYPEALKMLDNLHMQHPENVSITRDYLAVMSWAGEHDEQVVALYKTLPAGDNPDYVLAAVGVSYRRLNKPDDAYLAYGEGLRKYPDSILFAEGAIRSLMDGKKYAEAQAMITQNITQYGERPAIVALKQEIPQKKKAKKAKVQKKKHHSTHKHRHHG